MESLQRLFSNQLLRAVIFWGILMGFVVYLNDVPHFNFGVVLSAAVLLFIYWFLVKVNYVYLIPRFLNKKKLAVYGMLLVILAGILAPVRAALNVLIFEIFDPGVPLSFSNSLSNAFLTLIIVGVISAGLKIFSDWLTYTRVKTEMDKQNMQSELKFLRSQVNPHFLFNTLNSLYALTLKKSDEAPEIVIKLSEMMRYMLYECNEAYVPLYKEINYLKNYMELERLRHGSHIDIQLNVTGDVSQQRIAPLLFIPFIENSFKHGISKKIDDGFVHTTLHIMSNRIELSVENSKAPATPNPERKISGGIGLANVKRRLKLIYPDRHQLKVTDAPHKFNVQLSLQLN